MFFGEKNQEYDQSVKQLWQDLARQSVGPDLFITVCKGYERTALAGEELTMKLNMNMH